jgi:hypothetical protein
MSDGLSEMETRRLEQRRHRQPPPARHPKAEPNIGPSLEKSTDSTAKLREESPQSRPAEQPLVGSVLRAASVYLEQRHDDYLRAARAEGFSRRLDVTASAVVRLALNRLASEMTPGEVADHLARQPLVDQASGRKRR